MKTDSVAVKMSTSACLALLFVSLYSVLAVTMSGSMLLQFHQQLRANNDKTPNIKNNSVSRPKSQY